MRSAILTSMLVSVLALATGCAASSTSQAPRAATAAVDTSDPAWHPAEEMNVVTEETKPSVRKNDELVASMPSPNKRQILTGQLRAKN